MTHWRTSRATPGGGQSPGSHYRAITPRDSNPLLPSGSILEPFEVSEPPVYKFQLFERALLFITTAAALVFGFILLFVKT